MDNTVLFYLPKPHFKTYNRKLVVYSNGMVRHTKYSKNIVSDRQDKKLNDDSKKISTGRVASTNNILFTDDSIELKKIRCDSLSRSRKLLVDYACENEKSFHSFITLTFADNVQDVTQANKIFHVWRTKISRACKKLGFDFMYLGVPEFQERGAIHYHLLTNIPCDSPLIPKREPLELFNSKTKKTKVLIYYDIAYWPRSLGYSSAFDIIRDVNVNFNIALYITKYLYKDLDSRLFGHTRVLKSNNLKKPNTFELMDSSDTYKYAMSYISEIEKYDILNVYECDNIDNKYIIPSITTTYSSQCDNTILKDILKV